MKGQLWLLLICFPVNFSATGWHNAEADADSLKDSLHWEKKPPDGDGDKHLGSKNVSYYYSYIHLI